MPVPIASATAPGGTTNTIAPGSPPLVTMPPRKKPRGTRTSATLRQTDARRSDRFDGESISHVDEREQCPVRVRQSPHEAARFVAHVEIEAGLEAVEHLEEKAENQVDKERRPPEEEMATRDAIGVLHGPRTSVLFPDEMVNGRPERGPRDGGDPEEPELLERRAACEQSDPGASGRVH